MKSIRMQTAQRCLSVYRFNTLYSILKKKYNIWIVGHLRRFGFSVRSVLYPILENEPKKCFYMISVKYWLIFIQIIYFDWLIELCLTATQQLWLNWTVLMNKARVIIGRIPLATFMKIFLSVAMSTRVLHDFFSF